MEQKKVEYDREKTNNQALLKWLDKMVEMCGPKEVRWCDGSKNEWNELCRLMVKQGSMIKLNEKKASEQFFGPFGSSRRCQSREPNFYLQLWQG